MKPLTAHRESLAEQVYETIRDAIIMGELAPGTTSSVHKLGSVLNVSRTPVREALLRLADQGMVRFHRNVGVVILPTTIHDLEEVFSLRLLLEVPATYRATNLMAFPDLRDLRRALEDFKKTALSPTPSTREHLARDAHFHRVILRAAGNQRLVNFVDSLRDLQMIRGASTVGKTRDAMTVWREHEDIFSCIERRDPLGAARAMADHISGTAKLLLGQEVGADASGTNLALPWVDIVHFPALKELEAL